MVVFFPLWYPKISCYVKLILFQNLNFVDLDQRLSSKSHQRWDCYKYKYLHVVHMDLILISDFWTPLTCSCIIEMLKSNSLKNIIQEKVTFSQEDPSAKVRPLDRSRILRVSVNLFPQHLHFLQQNSTLTTKLTENTVKNNGPRPLSNTCSSPGQLVACGPTERPVDVLQLTLLFRCRLREYFTPSVFFIAPLSSFVWHHCLRSTLATVICTSLNSIVSLPFAANCSFG